MVFGFFICLDAFLFVFTLLPIRVCLAVFTCICRLITCSRYGVVSFLLLI